MPAGPRLKPGWSENPFSFPRTTGILSSFGGDSYPLQHTVRQTRHWKTDMGRDSHRERTEKGFSVQP
ncbi:MAG: hypothetical protein ACE5D3_09105, partial [Candidatus Binatia bacterium]